MSTIKKTIAASVLFAAAAVSAPQDAYSQSIPKGVKNVVLVHGAFADGSSWSKVIPGLTAAGLLEQLAKPLEVTVTFDAHGFLPLQDVIDGGPELGARLVQPAAERPGRDLEEAGGAVGVVALEIEQGDRFPQSRGQLPHQVLNDRCHLGAFEDEVRRFLAGGQIVGWSVRGGPRTRMDETRPSNDDRAEPWPESIGIPQRLEAGPRLPESFRRGVLG